MEKSMVKTGDTVVISNKQYKLIKLLGHGKGGYSYLAISDNIQFVIKQIHHEPCSYYNFGDKMQAELHDYERLLAAKVRIPKLYDFDIDRELIVKEYIDGDLLSDLVNAKIDVNRYIEQMRDMLCDIYKAGLNIDYYPTNFVVNTLDNLIYYIDYECNLYDQKWDFDNWGLKYWLGELPLD